MFGSKESQIEEVGIDNLFRMRVDSAVLEERVPWKPVLEFFYFIYFTSFITAQLGYQLGGEGREVLEGVKAGLSEIKEGV